MGTQCKQTQSRDESEALNFLSVIISLEFAKPLKNRLYWLRNWLRVDASLIFTLEWWITKHSWKSITTQWQKLPGLEVKLINYLWRRYLSPDNRTHNNLISKTFAQLPGQRHAGWNGIVLRLIKLSFTIKKSPMKIRTFFKHNLANRFLEEKQPWNFFKDCWYRLQDKTDFRTWLERKKLSKSFNSCQAALVGDDK